MTAGERALVKAVGAHATQTSISLDAAVDRAIEDIRGDFGQLSQRNSVALEGVAEQIADGNALVTSSIGHLGDQIEGAIENQGIAISRSIDSHGLVMSAVGFAAFLGLSAIAIQLGRINYSLNYPLEAKSHERTEQAKNLIKAYRRSRQASLLQNALECLDKAIGFDPSNASSYLWRARCRDEMGEPKPTEDDYLSALALANYQDDLILEFAMWLHREGRASDALEQLEQLSRPTDISDLFRIRLLCEESCLKSALELAIQYVEIKPRSLPILLVAPEYSQIHDPLRAAYQGKAQAQWEDYQVYWQKLKCTEKLCALSLSRNRQWKHEATDIYLENRQVRLKDWSASLSKFSDDPSAFDYATLQEALKELQAVEKRTAEMFFEAVKEEWRRKKSTLEGHILNEEGHIADFKRTVGQLEHEQSMLTGHDPDAGVVQIIFDAFTEGEERRLQDRIRRSQSHIDMKKGHMADATSRASKYRADLARANRYFAALTDALKSGDELSYPPKF